MSRLWPRFATLVLALGLLLPRAARAICSPDGLTEACTVCGQTGTRMCQNGVFGPCKAPELCNNCDDNADGLIDNVSGQGANTLTRPCGNNACNGTQRCQAGAWLACTSCAPKTPAVSCTTACGQAATYTCDPTTCAPSCPSPYAETCNGVDDDCNGAFDEGGVCRQDCCPAACGSRCGTIPGGNGCGGALTCPSCPSGQTCTSNNTCCTLTSCSGFCGPGVPNGCGGTQDCGNTCPSGYTCNTSTHQCACVPTTCAAQGKTCGTISDGCGGTLSCGTCGSGSTCTNNVCCQNLSCTGKCGVISNACGQSINCGGCLHGCCSETNVCVANCQ